MAKSENTIKLKPSQIEQAFGVLRDIVDVNSQPFVGQAKRLLYELQAEVKYLQSASQEDIQAIADREVEFGEKITAPQFFPSEYKEVLDLVCEKVPEKKSKLEELTLNGVSEEA